MTYTPKIKRRNELFKLMINRGDVNCPADAGSIIVSTYEEYTGMIRTAGMVMMLGKRLLENGECSLPLKTNDGDDIGTLHVKLTILAKADRTNRSTNTYQHHASSNYNRLIKPSTVIKIFLKIINLFHSLFSRRKHEEKSDLLPMSILNNETKNLTNNHSMGELNTETIFAR